jgi:hypothetical protein
MQGQAPEPQQQQQLQQLQQQQQQLPKREPHQQLEQQHLVPELVPVQLTLGSSKGTLQDWLLWPVASADEDLADFSEGLVRDLGVPLQFRRPVADAVRAQVADWVATVPPPSAGPQPRRELIRCVLQGDTAVPAAWRSPGEGKLDPPCLHSPPPAGGRRPPTAACLPLLASPSSGHDASQR